MRVVFDYAADNPGCVGVVPPSPNSSADSLARQEAIRQAHRDFQSGNLVTPGAPAVPVVDAANDDGVSSVESAAHSASAGPIHNSVDGSGNVSGETPVDSVVGSAGANSDAVPAGSRDASDDSKSSDSIFTPLIFPVDNPGPTTVAGGFRPLETFLQFGNVEFDRNAENWFKFPSIPTEFKLVAGPNGREFLFCIPDAADVDVEPVEPSGRRTVGLQVRPKTTTADAQCSIIGAPSVKVEKAQGEAVDDVPDLDGSVANVNSDGIGSGNDTTVSSVAAELERQEFLAAVELTKYVFHPLFHSLLYFIF